MAGEPIGECPECGAMLYATLGLCPYCELKEVVAENKRLKKAIKNVPTGEYGRAQMEGSDSCGAWDSFLEKLEVWKEQALKP